MFSRIIRKRNSLIITLTVRLVVTAFVLTAALLLVLFYQLQARVDTIRDRSLTSQAQDLVRHIERGTDGTLSLDLPAELSNAYADPDSDYFFQVYKSSGGLLFWSAGGAPALNELTSRGGSDPEFVVIAKPQRPRVYAAIIPVSSRFGALVIRVGQGEQHRDILMDQVLDEFLESVGWVLPLILTLFLIVTVVTVKHSLAPIKTISSMAARIGPSETGINLPESGLPEEIRPLVRAANSAFERLGEALRMQREFTADAAHELRTPLAVLNANIDTFQDEAAKTALKHDLLTMARIVDQLLKVAQLDTFVLKTDERANLCAIATDVAARLGHLAIERKRSISVVAPDDPVIVPGDGSILQHAITNLVENALAHTPEGTGVEIIVGPDGAVHVDDEGPGIRENERGLVFQRFWRKNRNTSGAGIGLSIVAKIAEAHHGTVRVSSSPRGGARFTLSLPVFA